MSASYTLLTKAKQAKAAPLVLDPNVSYGNGTLYSNCLPSLPVAVASQTNVSTNSSVAEDATLLPPLFAHKWWDELHVHFYLAMCYPITHLCARWKTNVIVWILKNKEVLMQTFPLTKGEVLAQSLRSREKRGELGPVWSHTTLWFAVTCYHKMSMESDHNFTS